MYGSDLDIVYADALSKNDKLKNDSFDVLIANPPYSVKGFLQTLSDEDKSNFELINEVDSKSYSKTGAIECFFIEKAKQLLAKDAVVGIIVPSSILNKDTPKLYTKTRELLLESFDIIAIAEFGSGTFGKTGTNTVTLFLRRISDNPNLKQYYIKIIEKDKLLYYALAQKQNNDIIIVKSPSKNEENKKFLGYEWGGRKGNEGIQYLTSAKIELEDELEDEDKRVLENLQGLKHINTPLYNPSNINDNTKINKLIKDTFDDKNVTIPDELKKYVTSGRLIDMMDIRRVDFNKSINLNPAKKVEIKSKWDKFSLETFIIENQKSKIQVNQAKENKNS